MLTTAPHLRTLRPSPTTAEFTVSTQLIHANPQQTLLSILLWILRISTLLSTFLLLQAKYDLLLVLPSSSSPSSASSSSTTTTTTGSIISTILRDFFIYTATSAAGQLATRLAKPASVWVLVPVCLAAAYLALLRFHQTEKLLVLRGLGIQTWSVGHTIIGSPATRFIPTAKVRDVLVNEAFLGNEVRFYLIVVVEGDDDVVVVFRRILPGRDVVLEVWNGVRGCLWEGGKNPRWSGKNAG